ncbi:MATE family efflux transporter [Paraburkholderia caballeronis]|uniref:Multidrug resistance protein, MATE family n=1 Tax=Paraburkholderia caballeronis TaxID=416943 RepID=A0A1H7V1B1_9BURK|nr:MATE family efflux transporter [Paraburkholderia caballeronis]PXW16867.1 MATE family multidrug resistance protein [Paraburkholderia caballeronis]PXW94503.1 MATE family multidrug resistance protein [Paraburkholderia caballeronis]RAJ89846.1 MATE family multidrug resistance protein [Paraburkholderia caballeronis]SEC66406.1 multidrug resistance protein, MATE family [Paraburkholderia caballeronis]SEM03031.1 multidrug resistance protein, MATE family [Paraburkholderia caballeronis]
MSRRLATAPAGWHRRVLQLAFPIVLANLTQPILGAVDTAVAGHLHSAADLGGVALGGLFFNFVFWGFGFLRMGTTGLVAQAFGAADPNALRANVVRALLLAFAIGAVVLVVQTPLIHYALAAIGGSDEVQRNARVYSAARIGSAPFALANYVVLGYLLGTQRVRIALATQVFVNAVNVVAVLVYVYVFGWGIAGIGAATATADTLGFVFGAGVLWYARPRGLSPLRLATVVDPAALKQLVAINRDIFLRTMCLLGSFGWFAHLGARQGDAILAANALLLNFQTFMAYGLDGFAHAAEALVGAAIGARNRDAFQHAVRVTMFWSVIGAAAFTIVYWVGGAWIIDRLTDQEPVRTAARTFLPWAALSPVVSVWGFLLDGVFIGATRTRELMQAMAVSLGVFLVASWLLVAPFANHGLWAALLVFMASRGLALSPLLPRIAAAIRVPAAGMQ